VRAAASVTSRVVTHSGSPFSTQPQ
jgi:hypothetical protein